MIFLVSWKSRVYIHVCICNVIEDNDRIRLRLDFYILSKYGCRHLCLVKRKRGRKKEYGLPCYCYFLMALFGSLRAKSLVLRKFFHSRKGSFCLNYFTAARNVDRTFFRFPDHRRQLRNWNWNAKIALKNILRKPVSVRSMLSCGF